MTQAQGRALRPTHPHIELLSEETARELQDSGAFSDPRHGWQIGFALVVNEIARGDGHLTLSDMGEHHE